VAEATHRFWLTDLVLWSYSRLGQSLRTPLGWLCTVDCFTIPMTTEALEENFLPGKFVSIVRLNQWF